MRINKKKIAIYLAIAGLVIIGIWLRVAAFPKDGMWFDELYSLWIAAGDFPMGILQRLYEDDAHAPLYHYIIHFYIKYFGTSDFALMMFNTLISVVAIPATYLLGFEAAGGKNNKDAYKLGLFSALLLTFNYFHICFSNETRFYNLTAIFLSLSTALFFKLTNNGYKRLDVILIVAINTLMCYTVTQGCIYVFLQALIFGFYFLANKRELIKPLVAASFATAMLFLPYTPYAYQQFWASHHSFLGGYAQAYSIAPYIVDAFYNWFAYNSMIYIGVKDFIGFDTDYSWWRFALYLFEATLFVTFMFKAIISKDERLRPLFALLGSLCALHIFLYIAHLSPFMPRYLLLFMPIFIVCWAGAIFSFKNKYLKLIIVSSIIVPGLIAPFIGVSASQFALKGRYKHAVETLNSFNLTKDDLIYKSHSAKLLPPKGVKATPIDVCHNATFIFYNPRRLHMIFGNEYLKYDTQEEREDYIENYTFDKEININNRNYYNEQIAKLKKGRYIVFWLPTPDDEFESFIDDYQKFKNAPREIRKMLVENFTPKKDYYRYLSVKIDMDYGALAMEDKRLKLIDIEPEIVSAIFLFKKVSD